MEQQREDLELELKAEEKLNKELNQIQRQAKEDENKLRQIESIDRDVANDLILRKQREQEEKRIRHQERERVYYEYLQQQKKALEEEIEQEKMGVVVSRSKKPYLRDPKVDDFINYFGHFAIKQIDISKQKEVQLKEQLDFIKQESDLDKKFKDNARNELSEIKSILQSNIKTLNSEEGKNGS